MALFFGRIKHGTANKMNDEQTKNVERVFMCFVFIMFGATLSMR